MTLYYYCVCVCVCEFFKCLVVSGYPSLLHDCLHLSLLC